MDRVIVVGAGIVGSSAAYRLARDGVSVTLIDGGQPGQATAAGAGIIDPGTSFKSPPAFYPLSARSVEYYPRLLQELAEDGETDTGYAQVGSLFLAFTDGEAERLEAIRAGAIARREAGVQGIGGVSMVTSSEARRLFPPLADVVAALHVAGSARVDGRLMRGALQRATQKLGARLLRGTGQVLITGGRVEGVEVDGEALAADYVIIAAGAWSGQVGVPRSAAIPVYPQRGQILHLDLPGVDTERWPVVLGFHSHYLLTFPPHRVVAGATREEDSGFAVAATAEGLREVTGEALRVAPGLGSARFCEVRVGLRPASPDGLPMLGPLPGVDRLFVATGHGPSGLQLGPYSGAVVAGLVMGRTPDLDLGPYLPQRFME